MMAKFAYSHSHSTFYRSVSKTNMLLAFVIFLLVPNEFPKIFQRFSKNVSTYLIQLILSLSQAVMRQQTKCASFISDIFATFHEICSFDKTYGNAILMVR